MTANFASGDTLTAAALNAALDVAGPWQLGTVTVLGSNLTLVGGTIAAVGSGSVTSIAASGGTTGLTIAGSPITTAGTLTLGGTLAVASGGTGQVTLANHGLLVGAGTSAITQLGAAAVGTVLIGEGASDPAFSDTLVLGAGIKNAVTVTPGAGSGSAVISFSQSGTGGYSFDGDVTVGHGISGNNLSLVHGATTSDQASINHTGSGAIGFDGNVVVGAPTGGGKGAGGLNAEALYVQGVAVGTGSGSVTSVVSGAGLHAGTITASGTLLADWNGGTVAVLGTGLSLSGGTLTAFANSDLSGLPTSDPGGGKPWLNGGVLQVGA